MRIRKIIGSVLAILLIFIVTVAMVPSITTAYDPSGTWEYELETPEGMSITGDMDIEKDGEDYSVVIKIENFGDLEIEEIEYEEGEEEDTARLTGIVDVQGETVDFSADFSGDEMEATLSSSQGEISVYAERA